MARMVELGVAEAAELQPVEVAGIPPDYAALGRGTTRSGSALWVAYSPTEGGDAALAAVAGAGEEPGQVVAVAPQWSAVARRRLAVLAGTCDLRALAAPGLVDAGDRVEVASPATPVVVPAETLAGGLAGSTHRELFRRALAGLAGLAAKHGGALRGSARGIELVVLARCTAVLRVEEGRVSLETLLPERSRLGLEPHELANALDRLEGMLRKRLNDRRVRGGEEGLRAQAAEALVARLELQSPRLWPLPGSDPEILDLLGLQTDGVPALGAARETLTLPGLGAILDGFATLRPFVPGLLEPAERGLRLDAARLVLAAGSYEEPVLRVLSQLAIPYRCFDLSLEGGRGPVLSEREVAQVAAAEVSPAVTVEKAEEPVSAGPASQRPEAVEPEVEAEEKGGEGPPRFESVSLFDLEEERDDADERAGTGRRRRRGRRRRGRRSGSGTEATESEEEPRRGEAAAGGGRGESRRGSRRPRREAVGERDETPRVEPPEDDVADDLDEDDEMLVRLAADAPEPEAEEAEEAEVPSYDDEEDAEEVDDEADRRRIEREARRRARIAKVQPEPEAEPAKPQRRRAAIVAHADRDSILAAVLLARDVRVIEGFWVYPQAELMTFFRSVCTDLREDTPICVVGFTASPARDVIQAASLYAGRLDWFDHQDWPPEDLQALQQAIGPERLIQAPGVGSSIPAVLSERTRRSRFSDKLVELATGAFTHHD